MENELNQNLSYFGEKFEIKFWNQFIGRRILKGREVFRETDFGTDLIQILKPNHFILKESKVLFGIVNEYHEIYRGIPFYDTIREIFSSKNESGREYFFLFLDDIENVAIENIDHVRNNAKNFIQQQNFFNTIREVEQRLKNGKLKSFDEAASIVQKSIEVNDVSKKPLVLDSETFKTVDDSTRIPIPTGLGPSFDSVLSGGPARGNLCVLGAGYGVGKTTFSVVTCSKAFLEGKTALYIYFEGSQDELISKFQAHWTGLEINETRKKRNKEMVEMECKKYLKKGEKNGGKLIIKKFDAINTKWDNIEQTLFYIEKVLGNKIDLIVIDYLDCIKGDKEYGDKNYLAGPEVLRKIEHAISEERFNCAAWVLIQGAKDSYGVKNLEPTMLGGSVDLLKIAHVLITVGKDFEQTSNGKANVNFWKNRLGTGRLELSDVLFDNAQVKIKVEDHNIVSSFEKTKKNK